MWHTKAEVELLEQAVGVGFFDRALLAYGRSFEHPFKLRIVRWLVRRLAAGQVIVRYARGAVAAIDPSDYIGWAIFMTGHYEPASLGLALRIMSAEAGLFVDVGANFGLYTCAIATVAGANVVSIEPDCENCANLRRNVQLNELQNVIIFNGAVGNEFGLAPIDRRSAGNSGTVTVASVEAVHGLSQNWIAMVTLDSLLQKLVCPPARPNLLKIDIEGFEPQALAGLNFSGPFRPKNILLEYDSQISIAAWGSRKNFEAFFHDRGYELLDIFGAPLAADGAIPEENVWARDVN